MTTFEPAIDPVLASLADAILIPPFPGTTAPEWVLRALERGLAGVTLFGPNVTGDLAALTASLRSASPAEPVIAIDEEAGDVTRVFYAGCPYPGNAALGAVDDVALTRDVYAAVGAELAQLGINTHLAPCADVLSPGGSHVIGTRSFGADPQAVARQVAAAVAGLQASGVAACAKHFPGHGSTSADSHLSLATISGTLDEVRARDLPAFQAAIAAGTMALMPGHLRVPELTGDLPATLSAAAVTGLLRGELGFPGVVICDALEMKAASAAHGIPEAAVLAVIAGVDLLCLGRDTDEAMYHAVRAAIADAVAPGWPACGPTSCRPTSSRPAPAPWPGMPSRWTGLFTTASASSRRGAPCDGPARSRRRWRTRWSLRSSRRRTLRPAGSPGASRRGPRWCGSIPRSATGRPWAPSWRMPPAGRSCWSS